MEKYNPLVMELVKSFILEDETQPKKPIAVFPGKFKPPHKDHIARIKAAAKDASEVLVLVSPKTEPSGDDKKSREKLENEMPIYAEQSLAIFKLANLPENVKVMLSTDPKLPVPLNSPVKAAYKIFEKNPDQQYIAVFGKEGDSGRYGMVPPNVTIKNYDSAAGNLSATNVRKALKAGANLTPYVPDGITPEGYKNALGITNISESCGCQHEQPTDFKSALASLTKYMLDSGMNIKPLPKLKIINNDSENASNILGKTAYYDPSSCSITLFTLGRHPKDILRSYAHEMIHRIQDNEGRLKNINTTNTNEDGNLEELEEEAYKLGNITLRKWEDSIKNV